MATKWMGINPPKNNYKKKSGTGPGESPARRKAYPCPGPVTETGGLNE